MVSSLFNYAIKSPHVVLAGAFVGYAAYQSIGSAIAHIFSDDTSSDSLDREVVIARKDPRVQSLAASAGVTPASVAVASEPKKIESQSAAVSSPVLRDDEYDTPCEFSMKEEISDGWVFVQAPRHAPKHQVGFDLGAPVFTLNEISDFIFGKIPKGTYLFDHKRIDTAFDALVKKPAFQLHTEVEIMSHVIYYWLLIQCGAKQCHYIPELARKDLVEQLTHPKFQNFGSILLDERQQYRENDRHVKAIAKMILHTPYSVGGIACPSIQETIVQFMSDHPEEMHDPILRIIVRNWIEHTYGEDIYKDIPLLRNRNYIQCVKTEFHEQFGLLYLQELDRFRAEKSMPD